MMGKGGRHKNPRGGKKGINGGHLLFVLYFVCFVLLIVSRLENDAIRQARGIFADLATPVLEAASQPAIYVRHAAERINGYLDLAAELDRLKRENERLRQWEWRAQRLEQRLAHLRSLLSAVDEPALKFVTGQVIADARGPFVRSILVNVGHEHGVKNGYAVIGGDGLVGRIVHSGDSASRVILLNDLNSRIPVLVGPAAARGVLTGDNTTEPRLKFLPENAAIFEGDEVITSGHGGLLPRGLRIGVVKKKGSRGYRVRTHARLSELEYVSVLFFDSPVVIAREENSAEPENTAKTRMRGSKHATAEKPVRSRLH